MQLWQQAGALAAKAPADRNRYVDFLRAVSILFVISGHWLIATAYYHAGELSVGDILGVQPWTQMLTWLFQVMPIFFIVGGYSNAVSIEGAARRGTSYAGWLIGRLNRLVPPLFALLCVWGALAIAFRALGTSPELARLASQAALIPIWFLAIYIMVIVLAPLTHRLWKRIGYWSIILSGALAIAVDVAFFLTPFDWLGWSNYFWIWLAMHQLGYAWRDGRIAAPPALLAGAATAFLILIGLVWAGPYPLAMAGSPDQALSNTLPPKIPLFALGLAQFCLLLAIEKPVQRWLAKPSPWTATVLINSMIMTVYLWHMTVMIALVGLAYLVGGFGLSLEPGSVPWWWSRPIWIGMLAVVLLPSALLLSAIERMTLVAQADNKGSARLVCSAIMICVGIATIATVGFDGTIGLTLDTGGFALIFAGVVLSGLLPLPGTRQSNNSPK